MGQKVHPNGMRLGIVKENGLLTKQIIQSSYYKT